MEVLDFNGQKLKHFIASGINLMVETNDIPVGMKLIRVSHLDGSSNTKKLMIQR